MLSSDSEGACIEVSPRSSVFTSPSPSPSPNLGRPRRSCVWNYFLYESSTNKSVCQIRLEAQDSETTSTVGSATVRGHQITGKYPMNLRGSPEEAPPRLL